MAVSYKYLETPQTSEKAVDTMQRLVAPLIQEYWYEEGRDIYGKELSFNMLTFIQMWMLGSLLLIVATEDEKPVGILIGIRFTPLMYGSNVVQVEVLYGQDKLIEKGMVDYLKKIVGYMNIREIWADTKAVGDSEWQTKNVFSLTRFVKDD